MSKILFLLATVGIVIFQMSSAAKPPDACFEKFRDDDCGMPPKAVMYYYKPGSRCEIAFWRGCLPNLNMFADEYACVRTCIFVDRPGSEDYHNLNKDPALTEEPTDEDTTQASNATDGTTPANEEEETTPSETGAESTPGSEGADPEPEKKEAEPNPEDGGDEKDAEPEA